MSNEYELEFLKHDLEDTLTEAKALAISELQRKYRINDAGAAQRDRLERILRDAGESVVNDIVDIAMERTLSDVTEDGQVFGTDFGPMNKISTVETGVDDLIAALELEREIRVPALPRLESARKIRPHGEPLAPASGLRKQHRAGVLDLTTPEILSRVAERLDGNARQFAQDIAESARELEAAR